MPNNASRCTDPEGELANVTADITLNAIVFDRKGNQIRTVLTGGKTHATFTYPSKRYRRAQTGDGATEYLLNKHHEVLAGKLDFLPQPCRIEGQLRGKPVRALPDFAAVAIGERPVLGEVKHDWDAFDRFDAIVQQALTRRAAACLGWNYRQETPTSLSAQADIEAVDEVQAHRFVHVPIRHESVTVTALANGARLRLSDLTDAMGETPARGRALACALMVRGIVEIDISGPVTDLSTVRAAPERPLAWPRIRL